MGKNWILFAFSWSLFASISFAFFDRSSTILHGSLNSSLKKQAKAKSTFTFDMRISVRWILHHLIVSIHFHFLFSSSLCFVVARRFFSVIFKLILQYFILSASSVPFNLTFRYILFFTNFISSFCHRQLLACSFVSWLNDDFIVAWWRKIKQSISNETKTEKKEQKNTNDKLICFSYFVFYFLWLFSASIWPLSNDVFLLKCLNLFRFADQFCDSEKFEFRRKCRSISGDKFCFKLNETIEMACNGIANSRRREKKEIWQQK